MNDLGRRLPLQFPTFDSKKADEKFSLFSVNVFVFCACAEGDRSDAEKSTDHLSHQKSA